MSKHFNVINFHSLNHLISGHENSPNNDHHLTSATSLLVLSTYPLFIICALVEISKYHASSYIFMLVLTFASLIIINSITCRHHLFATFCYVSNLGAIPFFFSTLKSLFLAWSLCIHVHGNLIAHTCDV